MFRCLEEGNEEGMLQEVNFFCDWMVEHYSQDMNNIRLKILEFIIWGEKIAFESGAINYGSVTAETIWILPCRFLLMRIFVNGFRKRW